MRTFIMILICIGLCVLAYFFPKGIKIFGINAETLFGKNKEEDQDYYS
ncbi:hypothetical protein [uncultured Dokdonia sp.]|nr:hypothetical protein [uncultured Dokdonia sp.]